MIVLDLPQSVQLRPSEPNNAPKASRRFELDGCVPKGVYLTSATHNCGSWQLVPEGTSIVYRNPQVWVG